MSEEIEEILHVPEEMINHPLGFVVDAGGSTTKVVYRSKKDYTSGKPIHDNKFEILHLRTFNMNQVDKVVAFLEENCDVIVSPGDDKEWWMTGVTTQHFKKELDSTFNIKTKLLSEMTAISNYMEHFNDMKIGCFDMDIEALSFAKCTVSEFMNFMKSSEKLHQRNKNSDVKEQFGLPNLVDCPSMKLMMTPDVEPWAKEHLSFSGKIEYPSLLVHLGSAGPIILVTNNGCKFVDFLYGIGKILSGLAEEITGESDFDKFITMAERGKLENVDMTTDDIRNPDHTEEDDYKIFPAKTTIFELGKLSSSNFKGKGQYNKDDLAIGILSSLLKLISKTIFLQARLNNVKSILISGSLTKYKLVRHHLQKCLMVESIFSNFTGVKLIKNHYLKNPGFLCCFGVWWENLEKLKEKTDGSNFA